MGQRHGNEAHVVFVPVVVDQPRGARVLTLEQHVVLGEHHALGQPRGARREQDQRHRVAPRAVLGGAVRLRVAPLLVGGPGFMPALHGDDQHVLRQTLGDGFHGAVEFRPHEQRLRVQKLEDLRHLRRRQPPVDRREDRAGAGGAHEHLEGMVGVLAQIGGALDARRREPVRDLVHMGVELREGRLATFEAIGDAVRDAARVVARDRRKGGSVGLRHLSFLPSAGDVSRLGPRSVPRASPTGRRVCRRHLTTRLRKRSKALLHSRASKPSMMSEMV